MCLISISKWKIEFNQQNYWDFTLQITEILMLFLNKLHNLTLQSSRVDSISLLSSSVRLGVYLDSDNDLL